MVNNREVGAIAFRLCISVIQFVATVIVFAFSLCVKFQAEKEAFEEAEKERRAREEEVMDQGLNASALF